MAGTVVEREDKVLVHLGHAVAGGLVLPGLPSFALPPRGRQSSLHLEYFSAAGFCHNSLDARILHDIHGLVEPFVKQETQATTTEPEQPNTMMTMMMMMINDDDDDDEEGRFPNRRRKISGQQKRSSSIVHDSSYLSTDS